MHLLKSVHKWLSLVIAIQLGLWLLSGLVFNILDPQQVSGEALSAKPTAATIANAGPLLNHQDIIALYGQGAVRDINLHTLLGRSVYRVTLPDRIDLYDAGTGARLVVTATLARQIAQRDYLGNPADIASISKIQAPTLETRRHRGPVWQVAIDDRANTTLYISAEDGDLLERRNDTWRLFDFFWMLHIMDYRGRQDFNHLLVIVAAFGCLWLAISGCILLVNSFSLPGSGFLTRRRRRTVPVQVYNQTGSLARELRLPTGATLIDALAQQGIELPSLCGGGGNCGQCLVRIQAEAPVSADDRRLIATERLAAGYRLACRQRVDNPIAVELAGAPTTGSRRIGIEK
ncbi:2Fe-2S iron-sulfur cluster binding domain-containing protein [Exilibacterium tricleocarpae]|uniref:2Fe-2S iron-sulfur cluster binding domain-containing protein n=1 Tax=Exilibacterium tricleocarpae TaxID=2591008 RepID=A0A545TLN3_9GAMM|nr:2Fe-2S iron-sulfur cluster-binding protein [Exilibacterium tricleocarpae]TQV78145.1 2Fe-2S iron-sulfur cluster binding domain-containing protein [Exilibacterium tricleocarpae]